MEANQVLVRPFIEADLPFILNSYLKSYRESYQSKLMVGPLWYKYHVEAVNKLIRVPESKILMAVNPEQQDQIFGYLWYFENDRGVFGNWAYVKLPFRRLGIVGRLVEIAKAGGKDLYFTHYNENLRLFQKHGIEYVPWYYFFKESAK